MATEMRATSLTLLLLLLFLGLPNEAGGQVHARGPGGGGDGGGRCVHGFGDL